MDPEKLKELFEKALAELELVKKDNGKFQETIDAKSTQIDELTEKVSSLSEAGTKKEDLEKLVGEIEELTNEVSDLRSKTHRPNEVLSTEQKQAMHEAVIKPAIGQWVKSKENNTSNDFFKFVTDHADTHFKTLNITTGSEGGFAVAEVLAMDVIDYAREHSPILGEVGRKPSMTRNYRQLVLRGLPGTRAGIEHVAGTATTNTATQTYVEIASRVFKVEAEPRITDEAMYGTDINVYADLVSLLGEQIGDYLAAQVLYGDGTTAKVARGILSSSRVDITDSTGESWKPVTTRDADFYPVMGTGVSGSLGADDAAIIDLVIDLPNTLPTKYLKNAKYHMNRRTKGIFEKVRDEEGRPIFKMNYMEIRGPVLNGYPVVIDDTLPDVAADSLPIIFGDLNSAYAINDGDINKMLLNPYKVTGCTVIEYAKEMFEMVQKNDAIIVVACTTNDDTA